MTKREEILTDDERKALDEKSSTASSEVVPFEFNHKKQLDVHYPTLDIINHEFIKNYERALFSLVRKQINIEVAHVEAVNFGHFIEEFSAPTSFSYLRLTPLKGTALVAIKPELIYVMVNHYFGGSVVLDFNAQHKTFTMLERRVIDIIKQPLFENLSEAWANIYKINLEETDTDINPTLVSIVPDDELVVVCRFHMNVDEQKCGDFYLVFPYSMLQPIRDKDSQYKKSEKEKSQSLGDDLATTLVDVPLELSAQFSEVTISLGDLLRLKPGDVIPLDQQDTHLIRLEGEPMFKAKLGLLQGQYAIRIVTKLKGG